QTYTHFELIIIVDNPDSKRLLSLLRVYEAQDKRVCLIKNEINIGLTRSLNRALLLAKGKYIVRMDADDISLPKRMKKQIRFMEEHPSVVLCGTQADIIDKHDKVIGGKSFPTLHHTIYKKLLFNNQMVHSAWCVRKNI